MGHQAYLKIIQTFIKSDPLPFFGYFFYISGNLAIQHSCRDHMIKLTKITIKYIKWAYTTDRQNLIIGIPLFKEGWSCYCYSHPDKLCLNVYHVIFDYSTWDAHISKTINYRHKQISDFKSRDPEDIT